MRLFIACCAIFLSLAAPAAAAEASIYGDGLSGTDIVRLSELMESPDAFVGKTVRVEGLVLDVCPKRGCWMEIAGDKEFQSIRVKVEDGVIVFPPEARGKRATAEGVFVKRELSEEQAIAWMKHEAEERGREFDPKTVAGPMTIYMIQGTGAVIR